MKRTLTTLIALALAGSTTVALAQGPAHRTGTPTLGERIRIFQSESSPSPMYQLHRPISNVLESSLPRAATPQQRLASFAAEESALQLASSSDVPFDTPPRQAKVAPAPAHQSSAQRARDFAHTVAEYQALSTA